MRSALDRGSGGMTAVVLFGAMVMLGLGGLAGANVILRVTSVIRAAESAAHAVASRVSAGDGSPCASMDNRVELCTVDNGVATVRLTLDGATATAVAGPDS